MLSEHSTSEHSTKVREHWENPATASLADGFLKDLEMSAIARQVPGQARVLDIGCGDGEGALRYAERAAEVLGIDYSETMIRRANARLADTPAANVRFRQADLLEFSADEPFDCIISERCLINLDDWPLQERALGSIRRMIAREGVYIMAEATTQGLKALNAYRTKSGLPPTAMPWHNRFFDLDMLLPSLSALGFTLVDHQDFGTYYAVSRVIHPLAVYPDEPRYESPINRAGYELQRSAGSGGWKGIGPISVMTFRVEQ